jgi:hypothetical protein
VELAGDRGMLISARIERLRQRSGLGSISSMGAPAIPALVEAGDLQLSWFDERNRPRSYHPTTPVSGSSCAATRHWPPSAPASAPSCLRTTEAALAKSPPSGCGWAGCRPRHDGQRFDLDIGDGRLRYTRD